ncbi:MAG: dihydrodipicolinate synthase family protein [Bryobacteraceae bacterium]
MQLPQPLRGIVTPLLTPLVSPDRLDADGLDRLVDHVLAGGVHGIFVLGTSGEGPSLSNAIRRDVIGRVCRRAEGRVPVLVGITDSSLADSVQMAQVAAGAGAAAVVTTGPLYMPVTQDQLLDYIARLAADSPLPVFLYNMPSHAHVFFEVETVEKASGIPGVAGLKDSSSQILYLRRLQQALAHKPEFTLMVGPEEMMAECVLFGLHGGVNGGSNLFPELFVALYHAAAKGDLAAAAPLRDRVLEISRRIYSAVSYGSSYLQGIKCAAELLGICAGELAPPYRAFTGGQRETVRQGLVAIGALPGATRA